MRVGAIYLSPVKSLALQRVEHARVGRAGFFDDRRFFLADARGKLFTQRQCGGLVQVAASYEPDARTLELRFPSGQVAAGALEHAEPIVVNFFGERDVEGHVVKGPWAEALSAFAGQPVRLVETDAPGRGFDGWPVSLCSDGSIEALRLAANADAVSERRFRPNIFVEGASAHEEDTWLERNVRVGDAVVLRVRMLDPRCVITTHSPESGAPDLDTLKIIAAYRTDQPKQVNFGVYASTEQGGDVTVGDAVEVM